MEVCAYWAGLEPWVLCDVVVLRSLRLKMADPRLSRMHVAERDEKEQDPVAEPVPLG